MIVFPFKNLEWGHYFTQKDSDYLDWSIFCLESRSLEYENLIFILLNPLMCASFLLSSHQVKIKSPQKYYFQIIFLVTGPSNKGF